MTTMPPEPPAVPHEPYAPTAVAPVVRRTGRSALAAALVFVGGYLVLLSLTGQLASALAGYFGGGPFLTVLYAAQFLFALIVVAVGLTSAVGSGISKLVGILVVVVGVGIVLAFAALRFAGTVRVGPESTFTISNPWFTTVLLVGIAWLLVRRARFGWLSLLAVLLLIPGPYAMTLAGVEVGIQLLLMHTLAALVGAGILLAGRPWRD